MTNKELFSVGTTGTKAESYVEEVKKDVYKSNK